MTRQNKNEQKNPNGKNQKTINRKWNGKRETKKKKKTIPFYFSKVMRVDELRKDKVSAIYVKPDEWK